MAPTEAASLAPANGRSRNTAGDRDRALLDEFLDTMPERYLLAKSPAEIAAHAEVALRLGAPASARPSCPRDTPTSPSCASSPATGPRARGLCVVAGDRPGLLAAISAAIAASRLEVHAAQINSRTLSEGGVQAVDLFWIRDRADGARRGRARLPRLERDLETSSSGSVDPARLARRARIVSLERTPVAADHHRCVDRNRASPGTRVIEVVTKDRPGLLFTLAQALHELALTIALAKINTEGSGVADVFYVTEADGSKVAPSRTDVVRDGILAGAECRAPSHDPPSAFWLNRRSQKRTAPPTRGRGRHLLVTGWWDAKTPRGPSRRRFRCCSIRTRRRRFRSRWRRTGTRTLGHWGTHWCPRCSRRYRLL